MRRADRLFQIVQHLRGRRLTTAAQLSQWLEVSERTVYRDISDLSRSGVPIEGEAGFGYRILRGFEVPPLMFTLDEVEALVIGARIVESWGGPVLGKASRSAIEKIAMALPSSRLTEIESTRLFAPGFHLDLKRERRLELIRAAILKQRKLVLTYSDADNAPSERKVLPLALNFWGTAWTLDRLVRIRNTISGISGSTAARKVDAAPKSSWRETGKTLADFLRRMEAAG